MKKLALLLVMCVGLSGCPGTAVDISGSWRGQIFNSVFGEGTISLSMIQSGSDVTGEFTVSYPGAGSVNGTVSGTVLFGFFSGVMTPLNANTCGGTLSGTVGETTISGSFASPDCDPPQTGTFAVDKTSD